MDSAQYQSEALVTLSHSFFGEYVETREMLDALNEFIVASAKLDELKKVLFYGRNITARAENPRKPFATLGAFRMTGEDETMLHGLLGIATEAGEIAEVLRDALHAMQTGEFQTFDGAHIREELGDLLWYVAVAGDSMQMGFGEMMQVNIAKLRARYKDKFDAAEANQRNLEFERSVMTNMDSAGKQASAMLDVATPELPKADDEITRYTAQMRDGLSSDGMPQGQAVSRRWTK